MPTREKFFGKPSAKRDMIGNRRVIGVNASQKTLAHVIDNIRPGEAVLVLQDIVPDVDPEEQIPYCSKDGPNLKAMRFLKRGPQVDLSRHYTIDSAIEAATAPHIERQRKFSEVTGDVPLSGYGWWGIRVRQHRKVHLADCVQGARIFAYSMQNQHNDERKITAREYNSDNPNRVLRMMGGDYLFEVPSTSEDGFKHDVLLYSVPLARGMEKFARVHDMGAEQSARSITKRVSKRYAGRELYFGKHSIAAYIEIARLEHEKGNVIPMQMCPFALPTQKTVEFYNRLEKRVMVEEKYTDGKGKERTRTRILNKAEKEVLLWQFVAKYGPKETFFAADKLQDYRWGRMYEPAA